MSRPYGSFRTIVIVGAGGMTAFTASSSALQIACALDVRNRQEMRR